MLSAGHRVGLRGLTRVRGGVASQIFPVVGKTPAVLLLQEAATPGRTHLRKRSMQKYARQWDNNFSLTSATQQSYICSLKVQARVVVFRRVGTINIVTIL